MKEEVKFLNEIIPKVWIRHVCNNEYPAEYSVETQVKFEEFLSVGFGSRAIGSLECTVEDWS